MLKSKNNLKATVSASKLNASLKQQRLSANLGGGSGYTIKDHAKLLNLDYLNSGHEGFAGIQFGTTEEWSRVPSYCPVEGMLVVYTDYKKEIDPDTGAIIYIPSFKIGNGNTYLADLKFVGDDIRELLQRHMQNTEVHIQPGERNFWNNKLNYNEPENDLLEFTRD